MIGRHKSAGKTAILVSHDMADVAQSCDQAAVLRDGRLAFAGSLADLVGADPGDAVAGALQEALEPICTGDPA